MVPDISDILEQRESPFGFPHPRLSPRIRRIPDRGAKSKWNFNISVLYIDSVDFYNRCR